MQFPFYLLRAINSKGSLFFIPEFSVCSVLFAFMVEEVKESAELPEL